MDSCERLRASVLKRTGFVDETLLINRNTLLLRDLLFHALDDLERLHLKSETLSCQCPQMDAHAIGRTQHQVKSRFLQKVVGSDRSTAFELEAGGEQALRNERKALLFQLLFHALDGRGQLHLKADGPACRSLHINLDATAQVQRQIERSLLLNVVM